MTTKIPMRVSTKTTGVAPTQTTKGDNRMATNRPAKPTVVSNQTPIHQATVTLTNAPLELVEKYRSRKPLRRPISRKGNK
jgi:hypothetical protein